MKYSSLMPVLPVLLAGATLSLGGCEQSSVPTEAAPEGIPGVSGSNGRLVLPAVKGNPGAIYFDIINAGDEFVAMRKVEVAGAKTTIMHETITANGTSEMRSMPPLTLNKGEPVKFEPGGKHVMAMELDPELKAGDATEITVTFAGGDKLSFPATVEAVGGGN